MPTLTIDNLFARRSIRQYTTEPVADEQIETLLQAAMAAPSASNGQPWHFVVVRDPATRAALAEAHPHAKMVAQSPVCIVPCGDTAIAPDFWVQDLSAATENILLAATALGLGAVWCGVHPRADRATAIRQILGIPEGISPLCLIPVGHPAEFKEPRTQYNPQRVHWERW